MFNIYHSVLWGDFAFVHLQLNLLLMKFVIRFILFFVVLLSCTSSFAQRGCDARLWKYVYNPQWLTIKKTCMSATGTVYSVLNQEDGNVHIRLDLDPGQGNLLSDKNISEQYGCLLVVPVCACEVTYPDARETCEGYINDVQIPQRGKRVKVTGTYVFNFQHGWYEIHPVTSITVLD